MVVVAAVELPPPEAAVVVVVSFDDCDEIKPKNDISEISLHIQIT